MAVPTYKKYPRTQLGLFLGERRRKLGKTQQEIADALGIKKAAVSHFERGSHGVLTKHIQRLAQELEISPEELGQKIAEQQGIPLPNAAAESADWRHQENIASLVQTIAKLNSESVTLADIEALAKIQAQIPQPMPPPMVKEVIELRHKRKK